MEKEKIQISNRDEIMQEIIELILKRMEDSEKGNLTIYGAILILKKTINHLKWVTKMQPLRHALKDES